MTHREKLVALAILVAGVLIGTACAFALDLRDDHPGWTARFYR